MINIGIDIILVLHRNQDAYIVLGFDISIFWKMKILTSDVPRLQVQWQDQTRNVRSIYGHVVSNNHPFERISGKQNITITTLSVNTGRFNEFL